MKILRNAILGIAAATLCAPAFEAHAVIDNPITIAVIKVYDKELQSNPKNYMVWFRRANEYYRHNEYDKALNDVNNALKYVPTSDTDLRFQAYMLRASIYERTHKLHEALSDLNSAVTLDPESYAAVYLRANIEYELGDYSAARTDYARLQRFNSRSLEAVLGLARCAVKENNLSAANDYLQQAVEFAPTNPKVYVRRASVRKMLGDDNGAVDDLILALSLQSDDKDAVAALVEYGNTNYAATITALTNAMQLAPDNALYRYLRAMIAEAHYNYRAAADDFSYILDNKLYNYHGINASLARCLYGLGRYDEALAQIDNALGQVDNVAEYYVLRSRILRALGRGDDAINSAAKALAVDRTSVAALQEMAMNYVDKKSYRQASDLLAEASMDDVNNPEVYLLRAWLQGSKQGNASNAQTLNSRALDVEGYTAADVRSLRGFALLNLGREPEADLWMENLTDNVADNDGLINYYAACYYTLRGNTAKALECASKSMEKGYSNKHNWLHNNDGQINVSALRSNPEFIKLVEKY